MKISDKKTNQKEGRTGLSQLPFWIAFGIPFIILLSWGVFANAFEAQFGADYTITHPRIALSSITQCLETSDEDESPATIDIGIECNLSMAGFLDTINPRGCPSSFYEKLLKNTSKIAESLGKEFRVRHLFMFNTAIADSYYYEPNITMNRSSLEIVSADVLLNPLSYISQSSLVNNIFHDENNANSSLAAALDMIDPQTTTILITDFVEPTGELGRAQLQAACESLFKQNLTIAIVAFESNYSGCLDDIGSAGQIYVYGTADSVHDAEKTMELVQDLGHYTNTNQFHRQPRYFYVVVVGSAEHCAAIIDGCSPTENGETTEGLVDMYNQLRKDIASKSWCDTTHTTYADAKVLYFGKNSVNRKLTSVDTVSPEVVITSDTVRIIAEIVGNEGQSTVGMKAFNGVDMHATGVDGYRVVKDNTLSSQLMTIQYTFMPDIERYVDTYMDDSYTIAGAGYRKVLFTPVSSKEASQPDVVQMIGMFYARYSFAPFSDTLGAFSLSTPEATDTGVKFTVTVNASLLKPGYYQATIPVILTRNVQAEILDLARDEEIIERTISRSDVNNMDFAQQPGRKTTEWIEHLQQINDAQRSISKNPTTVVEITMDIEIQ